MHIPLADIAIQLGAQCKGDGAQLITGIAPLETATTNQLSFLANGQYRKLLHTTQASAVIISPADSVECPVSALVMDNPYLGYAKAAQLFYIPLAPTTPGIAPTAVIGTGSCIHPSASIGASCVIGTDVTIDAGVILHPGCIIGNGVHIGTDSILWARVTCYPQVQIGQRVIIHSGCVLGGDGFGFAPDDKGHWHKIPQTGRVLIGNDVEIGANTTIDRGALGDTVIEEGVKLDNQIQIGHNTRIGAHTIIAGCVGIAGSTSIGKHCRIGGAAGIGGHLKIADNVVITAMSMVTHPIPQSGIYSSGTGSVQKNRDWLKNAARFRQLDKLAQRLQQLEKN